MARERRPAGPWTYVTLADDLRRRILEGEWAPGERLPSHRQLCADYGVASSTMAAARGILVSEFLLHGQPGARLVVRRPEQRRRIERNGPAARPVAQPLRAQEEMAGPAGEWSSRTRPVAADHAIAHLLRVAPGDRLYETQYILREAGRTVRVATCWEPGQIVSGTPVMLPEEGPLAGQPVERRMASIGIGPVTATDTLAARPASHDEAQALSTRLGAPVLEVHRIYADPDGQPVHLERSVVRGDRSAMVYRLPTT
ncbi:GntR family transcriptional regulator [Kitasatospora sp. NPDC004272]